MCKYKSAVVQYHRDTDSITIHQYQDTDSHTEIMSRAGLTDMTDDARDYVARVEKTGLDTPTMIDEARRPEWLTDGLLDMIDCDMRAIIMDDIHSEALRANQRYATQVRAKAAPLTRRQEIAARKSMHNGTYYSAAYRAPRGKNKKIVYDLLNLSAQQQIMSDRKEAREIARADKIIPMSQRKIDLICVWDGRVRGLHIVSRERSPYTRWSYTCCDRRLVDTRTGETVYTAVNIQQLNRVIRQSKGKLIGAAAKRWSVD